MSSADTKWGWDYCTIHVVRQPRSRYNDSILKLICSHLTQLHFWLNLECCVISMTLNMVHYIPSVWFHSFPRYPTLHVISSHSCQHLLFFYHFLMSLPGLTLTAFKINFIFTFLMAQVSFVFASPTILILSFLIKPFNLDSPYHCSDHHLK